MPVDPRFNFVVKCPQTANKQKTGDGARKDFFNAIGKVGDIELLNKVGDGAIASGLRTLAKTSNAIRSGDATSAIITNGARGETGESGSNIVLSAVGINSHQAEKAGQFNPGVLNRATAEAESVYQRVKQGDYKLEDVPNSVQDLQNLKTLAEGIFTGGANDQNRIELCGAKNYAQSLIRYAPKHKFMFVLQFTLKEPFSAWDGTGQISEFAFVVKNMGRPNINIEHEEVNFYNFWSRVPKRTVYEPITMRFYDDSKNRAHDFYQAYLKEISPISRLGGYRTNDPMNYQTLENSGLSGSGHDKYSSASLGSIQGNHTSIIDTLSVFHLFDYGRFMSAYHYKNPKMLSMNLDDLDMAEGATGNEVELQFAYDALHITPVLSVETESETVRNISGSAFAHGGHIEPVFQVGPSATDEAGGLSGLPLTDGEQLVANAKDAVGGFIDDAKQTAGEVYDAAGGAFDDASDFFS